MLIDIRRIPSDDDLSLLKWASFFGFNVIVVATKTDKVSKSQRLQLLSSIKNCVEVSVKQKTGLDKLLYAITRILFLKPFKAEFFIPYNESWAIQFFNENTQVVEEICEPEGTRITAYISHHLFEQVKHFACSANNE
jgi:50S ribosomal subunit-associated GTPase HflX